MTLLIFALLAVSSALSRMEKVGSNVGFVGVGVSWVCLAVVIFVKVWSLTDATTFIH